MVTDLQVEFKENLTGFHPDAQKLEINNEETQNHPFVVSVMVKGGENSSFMQIQLRSEFPGGFFRGSAVVGDKLVIAIENQLYVVNIITKRTTQYRLKGYFDHFQHEQENLFVLTNTHISCYSNELEELWISEKLGVEKVNIKNVEGNNILGSGKWDSDMGTIDFNISLKNGRSESSSSHSKKRKFLASFFASL